MKIIFKRLSYQGFVHIFAELKKQQNFQILFGWYSNTLALYEGLSLCPFTRYKWKSLHLIFFSKPKSANYFILIFFIKWTFGKNFNSLCRPQISKNPEWRVITLNRHAKKNMGSAPNLRCIENHTIEGTYSENTSNH